MSSYLVQHVAAAGSYVNSMYTRLCGAYASAKALGSAPCLALRVNIHYVYGEPRDLVRSRRRRRSFFEATAEKWRFQDDACHAYGSKVSLNHTAAVSHKAYER